MSLQTSPYKGTRDFYPEDLVKRNYIFDTWRKVLKSNGFLEYDASLLENADMYIAKSGQELGSTQLYNFHDKGDRHIALRPEMTPTLARLVANKFEELKFPLRWFSIPNCFRYERPQKGRLREHWQLNVDIIGLNAGAVELEILLTISNVFKAFGATKKEVKIMFNHRDLLDKWLGKNQLFEKKQLIYKVLDDWFKLSLDENKKQLLMELTETEINLIVELTSKKGSAWDSYLELAKEYKELKLILENVEKISEFEFELNPCIIRGIAYYTGLVLEIFDKNPENPRALSGGGRYDNLMELFDKQAPAIGFASGDVTMAEFLDGWNLWPENFATSSKVGILPKDENNLLEIFTKIIPEIKSKGQTYDINYEFERAENKRYESLKKRGCQEIISF